MSRIDRRTLLKGAAALAALGTDLARGALPRPTVGIQLYTLRHALAQDFGGTLAALKRLGYSQVETAGLLHEDAKSFRAGLDAAGLSAPSAHIFPNAAQPLLLKMATGELSGDQAWAQIDAEMGLDRLQGAVTDMVEQAKVMGYQYLVVASMDANLLKSMAGIKEICRAFASAAERCHRHGLKFAWHPHLDEWGMLEGKRVAEHILDATDPKRVFVELDFFWAVMKRVDVPAFLQRYRGRVHLGHIKDLAKGVVLPAQGLKDFSEVKNEYYEDVGYGQLDYASWIPLARQAGMRYFFVERDYSPDPLQSAGRSLGPLQKLIAG